VTRAPIAARLHQPVISIGNIAMGGRGKTPVTIHVARLLVAAGERPAILSRGYKRERPDEGAVVVSDGRRVLTGLDRSGDEPLMMAEAVPGAAVVVCDVRAMAGALAEAQLGATVHLLDDGFQHASLARDIDIVLLRPEDLSGRRLPFGRLRSPVSSLDRADAVIVETDDLATVARRLHGRAFRLERRLDAAAPIESGRELPPGRWPVIALAGIAEPRRFAESLRAAGWHVVRTLGFPDHHVYTARDLARIAETARELGAGAVLTTDKDAVRLRRFAPLPVLVARVPLSVRVEPADAFRTWMLDRLARAREGRS
jgi:tetraacyldisaccharide 4'-kinase